MRRAIRAQATAALALAACASTSPNPAAPHRAADVERGALVYRRLCRTCHGSEGRGDGEGASGLDPAPRDLVAAVYRLRTTPTGSLPTPADLARTIARGVPGTAMPAWRAHLSAEQLDDVVAFVQSLSPRFAEETIDLPIEIPPPVPTSTDSIARGAAVYDKAQCGKCHGAQGRGDGWAAEDEMRDDRGRVVRPRDFTDGVYRGGKDRRDLFRSLSTGLDGTPMPAYGGTYPPEELYELVNYLLSLERERGLWFWLSTRPRWFEPIGERVER